MHRIRTTLTWMERLSRLCPIAAISMELVRFDTQLMQDAEVRGVVYQQGELQGYEVREYLLEKWGRRCAYCGKQDIPLRDAAVNSVRWALWRALGASGLPLETGTGARSGTGRGWGWRRVTMRMRPASARPRPSSWSFASVVCC